MLDERLRSKAEGHAEYAGSREKRPYVHAEQARMIMPVAAMMKALNRPNQRHEGLVTGGRLPARTGILSRCQNLQDSTCQLAEQKAESHGDADVDKDANGSLTKGLRRRRLATVR
ncbi:hypothetical protein [Pseudaminobacter sp. NGMCC 1.201702]|uniref:hypothetical protein n=1 Tax=Pseudaminobacter sp. NGMCC 1.201702 TaxID=3391825 RepID=UPI0039F0D2C9